MGTGALPSIHRGSNCGSSSGELPDAGTLEAMHAQLLWAVAATAALAQSAPVAARIASLKYLPSTLLAVLKVGGWAGGDHLPRNKKLLLLVSYCLTTYYCQVSS